MKQKLIQSTAVSSGARKEDKGSGAEEPAEQKEGKLKAGHRSKLLDELKTKQLGKNQSAIQRDEPEPQQEKEDKHKTKEGKEEEVEVKGSRGPKEKKKKKKKEKKEGKEIAEKEIGTTIQAEKKPLDSHSIPAWEDLPSGTITTHDAELIEAGQNSEGWW